MIFRVLSAKCSRRSAVIIFRLFDEVARHDYESCECEQSNSDKWESHHWSLQWNNSDNNATCNNSAKQLPTFTNTQPFPGRWAFEPCAPAMDRAYCENVCQRCGDTLVQFGVVQLCALCEWIASDARSFWIAEFPSSALPKNELHKSAMEVNFGRTLSDSQWT